MSQPLKLLKHALHLTTLEVNKGTDPTEALTKVAKQLDLNQNFIQRTGEALNVALHFNHFKTAEDKSTDFPIARTSEVIANIFDKKTKTASKQKHEWFPKVAEDINYNKILADKDFKKVASELRSLKEDEPEPLAKTVFTKAANYIKKLEYELDNILVEKRANDDSIRIKFEALVKDFTKQASARTPFHKFESEVYALHGDESVPYIDLIYKAANLTEERGTRNPIHIITKEAKETTRFTSFLENVRKVATIQKEAQEAVEFVNEQKTLYKEACKRVDPLEVHKQMDKEACELLALELNYEFSELAKEELTKEAEVGMSKSILGNMLARYEEQFKRKNPSFAFKNTEADNHERIRILQELIMTDPILSKVPVTQVISAYESILKLAPQVTKHKAVMAAQLRAMVEGQALGPHDANQLVETNINLLRQQQLLQTEKEDKSTAKK